MTIPSRITPPPRGSSAGRGIAFAAVVGRVVRKRHGRVARFPSPQAEQALAGRIGLERFLERQFIRALQHGHTGALLGLITLTVGHLEKGGIAAGAATLIDIDGAMIQASRPESHKCFVGRP